MNGIQLIFSKCLVTVNFGLPCLGWLLLLRRLPIPGGGGPQSLMTEVDHALLAIAGEDSPAIIGICGGADSLQNQERCDDPVPILNTGKKHSVPTTARASTASTSGCLEKTTKKKLYDCYLEVEIERSKLEAAKIREETEKIRLEKELLQMQIKIHKNQLDVMTSQEVKTQIFDLLKEPSVKTEILDLTDLPEI